MSDNFQLSKLGLPVVLLGAIWGAFGVVMQAYNLIDNRRDIAFSIKIAHQASPMEIANAYHVFWFDWFPMWIGTLWFCLLFTVVIAMIPKFLIADKPVGKDIKLICWLSATLPGIGVIAILYCGLADIYFYFAR